MAATDPSASNLTLLREPLRQADGAQMLAGLGSALAWLEANQQEINDLNVFPVPDGDTGSNMYLTLRSAVEEARHAPNPDAVDSVMAAAAHGSLMGARGNSGVILSQILRGLAHGLSGRLTVDAAGVAGALGEASAVAYRAVMKPTEGTILTVIRAAATAAAAAAEDSADIRAMLERVVREAHEAVERTVDQLAVLRDAGVVDAGGFGLAVILEGFSRSVGESEPRSVAPVPPARRGSRPPVRLPAGGGAEADLPLPDRRGAAAVAAREEGWGYCTEFLLSGPGLDVASLRAELAELGDSALVVGDEEVVRVHIHTADPAALIAVAAQRGRMSKLKVEDMSAQHHEVIERAGLSQGRATAAVGEPVAEPKPLGVVAVAPGEGFRDILQSLGSDSVVLGGQTMNPSIEDILTAVRSARARSVIVLPNNGNVILTAQQVDGLADGCDVRVLPTRNLPQGISALLAYDSSSDVDSNFGRMQAAMQTVRAVEVTRAVRDSNADGQDIKEGDVIAIVDDRITQVGQDFLPVIDAVLAAQEHAPELVTIYRGEGTSDDEAGRLVEVLRAHHGETEFQLHQGGQEHYPYVLSLE